MNTKFFEKVGLKAPKLVTREMENELAKVLASLCKERKKVKGFNLYYLAVIKRLYGIGLPAESLETVALGAQVKPAAIRARQTIFLKNLRTIPSCQKRLGALLYKWDGTSITESQSLDTEALPIDELNISTRALNPLKSSGIRTVKELLSARAINLLALPGMGWRLLREVDEALSERGLAFK